MIFEMLSVLSLFISLALSASVFILGFSSIGYVFISGMRCQTTNFAFLACAGVTPLLVALWYFQQTGLELWVLGLWLILGTISLVKVILIPAIQGNIKMRSAINQVGITALFTGLILGCYAGLKQPATFGNNDLFNWYAVASTLIGKAQYTQMSPDAPAAFAGLIIDAFGTNWLLAMFSLAYDEPIQSATLFLVIASCWLALTYQSHLSSLFNLGSKTSILASVVPLTSILFIYLIFSSFFAQLLGTIGCALIIAAAIHIHANEKEPLVARVVMFFVPVLWILCVYQSGFVVFQFISVTFALFLFLSSGILQGSKRFFQLYLLPYLIALILSAVVLPSVVGHLIDRTRMVADIIAGWPLPLFPAHVFLSLPWPDTSNVWLVSGAQVYPVYSYLYITMGVFVLLVFCIKKSQSRIWRTLGFLWIWYILLVTLYFFWFHTGSTQYQNWKFATFFIFSISSLPLGTIILIGKQSFINSSLIFQKNIYSISIGSLGVAIGLAIILDINFHSIYNRVERIGPTVDEFSILRESIEPGMGVSLDLGDYGPSMLGMLMFSRTSSTYPIGQTYLPPATQFGSESKKGLLTSVACDKLFTRLGYTIGDTELARTENYVVSMIEDTTRLGYRFEGKGGPCGWGRKFQFDSGFSGSESWGRWTDGNRSQLTIGLPPHLMNRTLRVDFLIQPYLPDGQIHQRIILTINGEKLTTVINLDAPKIVTFEVSSSLNNKDYLVVLLDLPDAISPSIVEPGNKDFRTLGAGFIGLGLRVLNLKDKS